MALWSDKVLILIVDTLEWVEDNCGAAVTDVLVDVVVERVVNVVAVDEAGAELMGVEEEMEDEGDDEEVEVVGDWNVEGGFGIIDIGETAIIPVTDEAKERMNGKGFGTYEG